jgi:hypothetical protein
MLGMTMPRTSLFLRELSVFTMAGWPFFLGSWQTAGRTTQTCQTRPGAPIFAQFWWLLHALRAVE